MTSKIPLIVCSLICVALAGAFWNWESNRINSDLEEDHADPLEVVSLDQEQINLYGIKTDQAGSGLLYKTISAPATITIHSDRIAHIFPKVSGYVQQAYKNLGESVEAGELLGTLESREIAEAKTLFLTALKKYQLASLEFEREKRLHEKKISADQDFIQSQNRLEEIAIDLEFARQKLYTLGLSEVEINQLPSASSELLRLYEVHSPIQGRVIKRHFNRGELVSSEEETYVIANLDKVIAQIAVFPNDISLLKQGQLILLSCDQQKTLAEIIYISPILDEETRSIQVIAEIDNSKGNWTPGNFACATILAKKIRHPLVVSKDAIQEVDGQDTIFVVTEKGYEPRAVKLGKSDETNIAILEGLKAGETYATGNTFILKAELKKHEAEHMD